MKEDLIEKFKRWAENKVDIKSIIVIGSSVRNQQKGDKYSDIDFIIFTKDPFIYEKSVTWIDEIHKSVSFHNGFEISKGTFVKRIFFENEVAVDITFLSSKLLSAILIFTTLKEKGNYFLSVLSKKKIKEIENQILSFTYYLHRGYHFIVDKNNTEEKVKKIISQFGYKTEYSFELKDFEVVVNRFWQNAYRMAYKIKRNELFTAKLEIEPEMKQDLLNIISIYTKHVNGSDFETWHKGKFIEKWADPVIVEKLKLIYGEYNVESSWRSLKSTIDLFVHISDLLYKVDKFQTITKPQEYFYNWIAEIEQTTTNITHT
ncbi:MAG: aminoglycoside 6-adenylyltransferase [Mucilaginibacter sp.]|uniref:aminoglycoside 6-adenylyltransferase n=1 Tax=Mucilaginibacter sp. TaxID=1882438 RepID=UPI0032675F42